MGGDNQNYASQNLKDNTLTQPKFTSRQAEPTVSDFSEHSTKPSKSISPAYEKLQAQSKMLEQQRPTARHTHKTAHSFHNSRRFR